MSKNGFSTVSCKGWHPHLIDCPTQLTLVTWICKLSRRGCKMDEIAGLKKWPFLAGIDQVHFANKNVPRCLFLATGRLQTFYTPLLKGPHRLLNWQIQFTRVSWVGQSTKSSLSLFPSSSSVWSTSNRPRLKISQVHAFAWPIIIREAPF